MAEIENHKNPKIDYHFINPEQGFEWWICAGEKLEKEDNYYFFGVGKIIDKEIGFMTLKQIKEYGGILDNNWDKDIGLYDIL